MKNGILKSLYHSFVCKKYGPLSFRGGWMLAHMFWMDYLEHKASYFKIAKIHWKGWSYNDWMILGINDSNRKSYLSTQEYCWLHPLNGNYSSWIDDKLTLKYLLHGTAASDLMPDYYFEIMQDGSVVPLMNVSSNYAQKGVEGIVELLEEKRYLAFKLVKGSLGVGFYKASYSNNVYMLNNKTYTRSEFLTQLSDFRGYIITEYLFPHPDIAKYCDKSVGCLRYIVGRKQNREICDIYCLMRFGTKVSNFIEHFNQGGVLCIIGNDGTYDKGYIFEKQNLFCRSIDAHPDTGVRLQGQLPLWNEIVDAAHLLAEVMPQMDYMGIDFCITHDNKVKVIEINSLTGLDSFQIDKSIYNTPGGAFFKERLQLFHAKHSIN